MNPKSAFYLLLFWLLSYTVAFTAPIRSEHTFIDSLHPVNTSHYALEHDTALWLNLNRWTSGEQFGISASSKIQSRSSDSDGITLLSIVVGIVGIIAVHILKPENPRHTRYLSKKDRPIIIL